MFHITYFGKKIRKLRKEKNMKLADVAEQLHISPSYLGEIERGTTSPSIEIVVLIANYWGISLEDFCHLQTSPDIEQTFYLGFTELEYQLFYNILVQYLFLKQEGEHHF